MAAAPDKQPERPLDPDLVRFVEALAVKSARRDHELAKARIAGAKAAAIARGEAKGKAEPG